MSLRPLGQNSGRVGNVDYEAYVTTTSYSQRTFGFPAENVALVNDSDSDPVQLSWDGSTLAYTLNGGEYKDFVAHGRSSIWVKSTAGSTTVRITAT